MGTWQYKYAHIYACDIYHVHQNLYDIFSLKLKEEQKNNNLNIDSNQVTKLKKKIEFNLVDQSLK